MRRISSRIIILGAIGCLACFVAFLLALWLRAEATLQPVNVILIGRHTNQWKQPGWLFNVENLNSKTIEMTALQIVHYKGNPHVVSDWPTEERIPGQTTKECFVQDVHAAELKTEVCFEVRQISKGMNDVERWINSFRGRYFPDDTFKPTPRTTVYIPDTIR